MFVKRTVALVLGLTFSVAADEATDKQIQELKDIVTKQQVQLESMNKQIKDQEATSKEAIAQYVRTEVETAMKKQGPLLKLGKQISALKISGDLRLRYHHDEIYGDKPMTQTVKGGTDITGKRISRDRIRQRLRIGMNWESADEHWEIGARLATGDANGRSTNDTYGDEPGSIAYEHGDIRVDLAYAKLKLSGKDDDFVSALTLGQQPNLYKTSWVFMDTDINPVGVSYTYDSLLSGNASQNPDDRQAWFNSVGLYTLDHRNSGWEASDVIVAQVQTGYRHDKFLVAAGFTHFSSCVRDQDMNGVENSGDIRHGDFGFDVAELYGEVYALGDASKDGRKRSLKFTGDISRNLATESRDSQIQASGAPLAAGQGEALAWLVSADGQFDKWSSSLGWAHVEQDALPKFLLDAEFANGQPGYEGAFFRLGYNFTSSINLSGIYAPTHTIHENASQPDRHDLYMLDLIWKF